MIVCEAVAYLLIGGRVVKHGIGGTEAENANVRSQKEKCRWELGQSRYGHRGDKRSLMSRSNSTLPQQVICVN